MSKSSCRFVVTKKDDCCYKTTTETVVGLYGVAIPAFPPSSTKDSVHVVRYDDALVTYVYNGTAWVETTNTPITSSVIPGTLVDNGDGTYTWTDTVTTFVIDTTDRVLSTVVYSPATQDFTFTWSNGDTTVVDLTALLNIYSLVDGNNTTVTGDGVATPWEVNGYGIVDNTDGTFTVTLPDGVTTFAIDTNDTVTNIVGNTYTNEAGTPQAIVQTVVNTLDVNGDLITTVNGIPSTPLVLPADIVTTLAAALDTTNPLAPTLVITYVNEDGSNGVQNVNLAALLDNTNTTYTVTNNNDGTITLVGSDGNNTLVDICAVVASGCPTTLTANVDGSFTFVGSDGTPVTIPAPAAVIPSAVTNTIVGNRIATHTPGGGTAVDINETITTIVNNGDGTATFTNEAGATVTFPIGGVDIVDNADGTYTVTLADGSVVTIGDTSVSTLVDNLDGTFTYTNEAGVVTTFDTTGVITTITNTITGNKIADYTNEAGAVVPINESITSFAAITNGYQFTSENGTVYPFTFTFDNTTPSAPQLLVNYGATVVSTIPLNSYDVNIATTGGFTLNPLTDEITITETDGETHVIDLSYLRSTITSTDGSVQSIISINPDGSTNYDLGVKAHTNQVETVPYTGTELPSVAGINIGDTTDAQFSDGTVVNYTWDGTAWVKDFDAEWYEKRICLNTATVAFTPLDPNNPTTSEVQAWKNANLSLLDQTNGTILTYFVPGDGGSCDVPDYTWTLNKGSELITFDNKVVKNSNTIFVDPVRGSNVTGKRNYHDFPFKSFSNAIAVYQNNDWIRYWNTNETITTNINSTAYTSRYIDFGGGSITLAGLGPFIGAGSFVPVNVNNTYLKSDGEVTTSKSLCGYLNGDLKIDFNKLNTSKDLFFTKDNVDIKIKEFNSTSDYHAWFSGSSKQINIEVDRIKTTGVQFNPGWTAGLFTFEGNGTTSNSNFHLSVNNIEMNSASGIIHDVGTGPDLMTNCRGTVIVNNVLQSSTLASYPSFPSTHFGGLFLIFRSNSGAINQIGVKYDIKVNTAVSDVPFLNAVSFGNTTDCVYTINAGQHTCLKTESILIGSSPLGTLINSNLKLLIDGNFVNTSSKSIIEIGNAVLSNNSVIMFDGTYKSNGGIKLTNTSLDATSKIVFKGRYELGNGFFDISGVTGAGADNIYFEDCTIVTNNTECIVSGTAKNIKVLNVRSNKPTNANVTETIQSVTVNTNIN